MIKAKQTQLISLFSWPQAYRVCEIRDDQKKPNIINSDDDDDDDDDDNNKNNN